MFRNEHLPFALCIGISEELFWTLNPRKMKPYVKAYEMKRKQQDENDWILGRYFLDALLSSVGNMFKKNGQPPHEYPKKPYLDEMDLQNKKETKEVELTEEEKNRQIENLFMNLRVMQFNFENKDK